MEQEKQSGLTPDEIDVFARGLYHLANVDGIDPSETDLIREFLQEAGSQLTIEDLQQTKFDARELPEALETSFLQRIFVRTAIALVKADGRFSDEERLAIGEVADALGMSNAEFGELEQQAAKMAIA
ncbi:MAG: TerB family tellurite resistance protein [Myxococcales bacterium]|nr:TerB family tellurite resistance protein [Myxococcales bacterium]